MLHALWQRRLLLLLSVLVCVLVVLQPLCWKVPSLDPRGLQDPCYWPATAKACMKIHVCTQLLLHLLPLVLLLQVCLLHLLLMLVLPCSMLHPLLQLLLWGALMSHI